LAARDASAPTESENQKLKSEADALKEEVAEARYLLHETLDEMRAARKTAEAVHDMKAGEVHLPPSTTPPPPAPSMFSRMVNSMFGAPQIGLSAEKAPKVLSLASFWTSREPPKKVASLLAQSSRVKQVDMTEQMTEYDELHSVDISDPFEQWELEDQQASQLVKSNDRRLRKQAAVRDKPAKLSPEMIAMYHGGQHHISGVWEALEEQDSKIQSQLDDLDNPRLPLDLRNYERLNNLQDSSMKSLEESLQRAEALKR